MMIISANSFEAFNNFEFRPDWRYAAIQHFSGNPIDERKRKLDPIVDAYVRRLRKRGCLGDEYAARAYEMYLANGLERAEIQARVVTGESECSIALKLGLPEQVIVIFEQLFFDVRHYPDIATWLNYQSSGIMNPCANHLEDVSAFWSFYGLSRGPAALDQLIHAYKSARVEGGRCSLVSYLKKDTRIPMEHCYDAIIWLIGTKYESDFSLNMSIRSRIFKIAGMRSDTKKLIALSNLQKRVVDLGELILAGKPLKLRPRPRVRRTTKPGSDIETSAAACQVVDGDSVCAGERVNS